MAEALQDQSQRPDFFISYTGIDRSWATWLAWQIEEAGYTTRIQAWDFRPGSNFVHAMQQAATEAERTLAVLSPDYLASDFAQSEWYAAFAQDPLGEQGLLLPVQVRSCNPGGLLSQVIYVDLVGLSEDDAKTALRAGIERTRAKPLQPPGFPGSAPAAEAGRRAPRFPGTLPPVWNVPHHRNPNFTGRAELLSDLYDSLHAGNATVLRQALRGLGGVGKTQLALEYAYRHAGDYSVVWWVPSETSPATVYGELTRELGLPEAEASESEVRVQAVKLWLERHEGWLLVFDNATEPDAVKPYLPQGQSGHVIITSRYWDWGDVAEGLGVEVFDREEEAVPFLLRRTSQADRSAAAVLSEALGDLPLALAQAAAYIASAGITLAEYLEVFEARRAELWQDEAAPESYPEPVATAWSLSMEQMEAEAPAAAELLRLMAFLAPEPVARDWLSEGAEHLPEVLRELVTDQLAWNRSLRVFRRYGLVEVNEGTLVMHRLVQAVARDRLAAAEQQAWAAAAV